MRVEIFDAPDTDEQVLRLRLVQDGPSGDIRLLAVDKDGDQVRCGKLLKFRPGGVYRYAGINRDIGLGLDPSGRWKPESW